MNIFAQNPADNWFFGVGAGVNYFGGTPSLTVGGAITSTLGCSAISDVTGNVLFYTNGVTIYNQSNSVMANGSGLHGTDASQSSIIIKQPNSQNIYYVFTVGGWNTNYGLKYSIVDMTLAAGMGSVTAKNVLLDNDCRDKLTAGKHCNGIDIWIVSTRTVTSSFVSYLLSPLGIGPSPSGSGSAFQSIVGVGQIKISPNSRKLAIATQSFVPNSYLNSLFAVFNFDNATGAVTNQTTVFYANNPNLTSWRIYNCEFSPNSTQLYYSLGTSSTGSFIYRQDLCASSPSLTGIPLYNTESIIQDTVDKRSMQLAPNGQIYVAKNGKTSLGSISNPNNTGPSATYFPTGLSLGSFTCSWGLPNFPGYYFEKKPTPFFTYTVGQSCLTASFSTQDICAASGYSITAFQWNFGDPLSSTNNTSILQYPSHTYSSAGNYTTTLIRSFYCSSNDTITQIVTVAQPTLLVINSKSVCLNTTASASVIGGVGPFTYTWSVGSQTTSTASFSSSGVYSVTIKDEGLGSCERTATTGISVISLSASVNNNSVLCFGQNTATANIVTLGGSGNYVYTWTSGTSTLVNDNALAAGFYSVDIVDTTFNCTISKTFTVTQPSLFANNLAATNYSTCTNQSVIVAANSQGGTQPYSYLWSTGSSSNFITITQTVAGNYGYTCTAVDAQSCTTTNTIQVSYFENPSLNCSSGTVCKGDTLILIASGASNYTWFPISVNANTLILYPNNNSTYTLVAESNGCITSTLINVVVNTLPVVILTSNSPVCTGQTLNLSASTFQNYDWKGPDSFISNIQSPIIANCSTNQSGIYKVTVVDNNNCSSSKTISVLVNPLPEIKFAAQQTICIGEVVTIVASGASTYNWLGIGVTNNSVTVSPSSTTVFTVNGTSTITGCSAIGTISIAVLECVSLQKINFEPDFKIYPNPAKNLINIESPNETSVQIFSSLGEIVYEGELMKGENVFVLSSYNAGLYFIKFSFNDIEFYKKIVLEY